jgi:hypothetical protein
MAHTTDQDWPSHYRAQAQECREYAAKAATQPLREEWLKMTDEWITLAKKRLSARVDKSKPACSTQTPAR